MILVCMNNILSCVIDWCKIIHSTYYFTGIRSYDMAECRGGRVETRRFRVCMLDLARCVCECVSCSRL